MFPDALRIALLPNGPFIVNVTSTGKVSITGGYETGLLDVIVKGLKRHYTLHVPKEHTWGAETPSGYWTGLVGMIHRGEVDIAVGSVFLSESRMKVVEFSSAYNSEDVIFATKLQRLMSKGEVFFQPFSGMLWVYIGITYFLFLLFLRYHIYNKFSFMRDILLTFGILLRQAACLKSEKMYGRLVLMSWLFFSFFISYSYTGTLLSYLTVPTRERGIRTVSELSVAVSKGRYKCSSIKGSIIPESLANSESENYNIIGQYLVKHKHYYIGLNEREMKKYFNKGRTALVTSRENIELHYHDEVNMSEDIFYSSPIAVAMKKNFPLKTQLERSLMKALDSGIYLKSFKDFVFRQKVKDKKNEIEPDNNERLSMKDLYGIFTFLAIGNTIAVFVCVGEIVLYHWSRRKFMKTKIDQNLIRKRT